jgi:PKD repeat protein
MLFFRRRTQASAPLSRFRRSRGQSLVEFALVLPVILLLTMVALDFGRVYLGYINLQNMTRAAANFAANNSTAWSTTSTVNTATITKYRNQVLNDAAASNCQLNPAIPVAPVFSDASVPADGDATGIGDNASVALTCKFQVITPVISAILGGSVNVSSSAVFPVKTGMTGTGTGGTSCILPSPAINTVPNPPSGTLPPLTVTFTDASGGGGTAWSWNFGDINSTIANPNTSTSQNPGSHTYIAAGTYTVTLSVTNACGTVTTNPGVTISVGEDETLCTVPLLDGLQRSNAQAKWGLPNPPGAGFTTIVQPTNGNWKIVTQSIVAGSKVNCGSTITVTNH